MISSLGGLAKAVGIAFGVKQLIQFGATAIEVASDVQEVQNVVDTAFKSMAYKMEAFADTAIESFGISKLTAKQTGSTFMSMASGMNLASEYASDLAVQLTGLSADMASFYNVEQSIASTALKSIFTGETEALKQFGVVMTEVNLQEYALSKGITKAISKMSQQEKVMLRAEYVTEQLNLASGDFAKTQDSWANQTRILTERWKEFKSIIGTGLITVLTPALRFLNDLLQKLIDIANAVGEVMSELFGLKVQKLSGGSVTDATGEMTEGLDGVTSSANEAEKAMKNAQAAFDDVDVLERDDSSSTETGGAGTSFGSTEIGSTAGLIEEAEEKISLFSATLEKLKTSLTTGWDYGFRTDKLAEVKDNLTKIKESIVKIFSDDEVAESFDEFANQVVRTVGTITGSILSIATSLVDGVTGGVKQAFENSNVQQFASEKIASILNNLKELTKCAEDVAAGFAEVARAFESEGFKRIVEFIEKFATYVKLTDLDTITGFLSDFVGYNIKPFTENIDLIRDSIEKIFEILGNLLQPVSEFLDILMANTEKYEDSSLHKFMQELTGASVDNARNGLEVLNIALTELAELTGNLHLEDFFDMQKVSENLVEWYENNVKPLFTVEYWREDLQHIGEAMALSIEDMAITWNEGIVPWWEEDVKPWFTLEKWKSEFGSIAQSMRESVIKMKTEWSIKVAEWWNNDVKPWFTLERWKQLGIDMANGIGTGFETIVQSVKNVINNVLSDIESGMNNAISWINEIIAGYNKIASASSWLNTITPIEPVNLPRLAQGAVFQGGSPYMAIVNDQPAGQTNVETPLSTIQEALQNVIDGQQGYSGGTAQIILDGQVVGTLLLPHLQREESRIGTSLVVL